MTKGKLEKPLKDLWKRDLSLFKQIHNQTNYCPKPEFISMYNVKLLNLHIPTVTCILNKGLKQNKVKHNSPSLGWFKMTGGKHWLRMWSNQNPPMLLPNRIYGKVWQYHKRLALIYKHIRDVHTSMGRSQTVEIIQMPTN